MTTATALTSTPAPGPLPHLVVFGRDAAGKPHASWFDQASAELATKAAGLMNMQAVVVASDALRELVGRLPQGRVFSSGRAFTPFVAGKLYTQLVALTGDGHGTGESEPAVDGGAVATGEPQEQAAKGRPALQLVGAAGDDSKDNPPASPATPAVPAAPGTPAPAASAAAAPGQAAKRPSRVEEIGIGSLVLATTGPAEGWWEAEVIGLNGNMLTLRWRDFSEPTVVRRRTEVGYLPAMAAG